MYPLSSNSNTDSPICSSLFNIPSPSMQYEHELLFQYYYHDPQPLVGHESTETTAINNIADSNKLDVVICSANELNEGGEEGGCNKNKKGKRSSKTTSIPKNKRGSRKDRHSKINTAQGLRDRRIRLSIEIARNFFKLQDMLEFDKASKTVEWLLIKSNPAIKELVQLNKQSCSDNVKGANSASATSECEVVSGIDEYTPSNDHQRKKGKAKGTSCNNQKKEQKKKKAAKLVRRAAFHPAFAKQSRKQARERARERTKLKKCEPMAHEDLNIRSWSEESGHTSMSHPSHEIQAEVEEFISHHEKQLLGTKQDIVNDCNLVVTGNWSPYAVFNYQQNFGTLHMHEHQFTDFSFLEC